MKRPIIYAIFVTLLSLSTTGFFANSDTRKTAFCEGPSPGLQTTCEIGFMADDFRLLGDPELAFNARFKALMGYELSTQEFNARDPKMTLDFSRAPRLDEIVISTLVINNDFFGSVMFRALAHHLEMGTKIKIYVSGLFLHPLEKNALEKLRRIRPENITISVFNYKMKHKLSPHEWVNNVHRSMHVKVFLTYSNTDSKVNTLITGGRNFSDTYFYPTKPDYSKYPEMSQYGTFNYPYAYFDDLDFETHDLEVVLAAKSQVELLMEADPKTNQFSKVGVNSADEQISNSHSDSLVSIEISAPFLDHKALQTNYVHSIDQAKTRIRILSPYIRFTQPIFAALERARRRGVKIEIVTARDYNGDVVPFVLKRSIELFLRKIIQNYDVYLYEREPGGIMHAKAMLIDDQTLALGSVNMNRRSFNHDIEVTYYLRGSKVINQFNQLFEDRYLSQSKKMTELPKEHKIYDPLIYLMGNII